MPATYPSGTNTFVPDFDATGRLVVGFSRNPNSFPLNRYIQIIPVKKTEGLYLNITAEEAARLAGSDLQEFDWPDGADSPSGEDGTESFEFLNYRTKRSAYSVRIGDLAENQADWEITDQHLAIKAQQAMTARTMRVIAALTATGNYDASHVINVTTLAGNSGSWAASTTARQDIKRSLNRAAILILQDTLSVVRPEDLHLVINPNAAAVLSECQEIVDHIKGSPDALAQVRGELPGRNVLFGLPDKLYGYDLVVEDTVRVTTKKGATTSRSFLWPQATAALAARPGKLVAPTPNAPNFSTCGLFVYEDDDMTVERRKDVNHRRTEARIVDNNVAKVLAPASGAVLTNIL